MNARLALIMLAFAVLPLHAEEPHLEFARALRANGMADLAVDYLERLSQKPPANLKDVLPLELARARLDLAVAEGDDKKRNAQFLNAQKAYEAYLKANPNSPRAAEARLDLARLTTLQGKQLLAQARRSEDKAARRDLAAKAGPLFNDAATKLAEASRAIDDKIKAFGEPSSDKDKAEKESLIRAKGQANLESAINKLNQALTMSDATPTDIKARAKVIGEARTALEKIRDQEKGNPFGFLASAWVGKCLEEQDNKPDAIRAYEAIAKDDKTTAQEASRLARYWLLLIKFRDQQSPRRADNVKAVVDGCEQWLKDFPGAASASEGLGIRYLLASAIEEQAQPGVSRDANGAPTRVSPQSRTTLLRAEKLLKEVGNGDNEYTERARNKRAGILVALMAERSAGAVSNLNNFEECYLTAQVEAYEATQGKKSDSEKARRLNKAISALNRGLQLVDRNDNPRDVADARVMLTYAYLTSGDPYAAATLGEYLGKSNVAGPRSVEATAYALQGYSQIIGEDRSRSASEDELKADQRRLRNLAAYMEKTWPDEPVTDFARHQLASFLEQDGNFSEALAMLARISPSYPGLTSARYLQGAVAQKIQGKDVKIPDDQKKTLLRQVIADLEKLPNPVPGASEETTLNACMARLQLGNLYLLGDGENGSFQKAAALGKSLADIVPGLSLEKSFVPQVQTESEKLQLAGVLGQASQLLKADKVAEGGKLLEPLMARVSAEIEKPSEKSSEAWYGPYREVQSQVLLLALRSAILDNRPADAQKILSMLDKSAKQSGNLAVSANDRLLRVVFDLKKDAEAYKAKNETEKREKLEKGLSAFLDEMARPADLAPNVRAFLAQAYSSLERHEKAAELLAAIRPPAKPDDEDGKRFYQFARLSLAREHRLAKQFSQGAVVLGEILKDWGKSNLDVRAERVFLQEDGGNLAGAVRDCREIQQALGRSRAEYEKAIVDEKAAEAELQKAKTDAEREAIQMKQTAAQQAKATSQAMRDRYWEFYFYELRVVLKSANLQKDPQVKDKRLNDLVQAIRKLEDSQDDFGGGDLRARYAELIEQNQILRKKYVEAGGKKLLPMS